MKVYSQAPYYDDYNPQKKFYRTLYRYSYPVQARELTQQQTVIQSQIERLGDHFFAEGAKVIDGQMSFDTNVVYVKLQATTANVTNLAGQTIQGLNSGVTADIITAVNAEGTDPATLFVKYRSSGSSTNTQTFERGETLSGSDGLRVSNEDDALGFGSIAQIQSGIYYVDGIFATVDEQTIVLDKYGSVPSYRVGLLKVENVVTPEDDSSILDNSAGSSNFNAPGAHRYSLDLVLTKVGIGDVTDENFVELGQIQSGQIVKQVSTTEYTTLEQTLARRTYDESGDYTVRPFKIGVREHRSNDRGAWKNSTRYLRGDVVKNAGRVYTARTDGYSLSVGAGPQHASGTSWENNSNSSGVLWEVTANPEFNNGVYNAEGKITKLELINGGSGYLSAPLVEITGGGGTGATASAVVQNGSVIRLILTNSGSGFISDDIQVTFRGSGTGAVARAYADFGVEDQLAISLESGKAYVQGFEIEKVGTSFVPVKKARTTAQNTDAYVSADVGNFVYVSNIHGMPPCSTLGVVDLYDQMTETSRGTPKGEKIGTARVRGFEWDSGTLHSDNGVYKLYLFDINLNNGKDFTNNVKSFYFPQTSGSLAFTADVANVRSQISGAGTTYTTYPTKGASTVITGSSTSFQTDVVVGDYLFINNQYCRVVSIQGQNQITVDRAVTADGARIEVVLTTLNDPQAISAIYPLPNSYIKSVTDVNGANNISYYTMEYLSGVASAEAEDECQLSLNVVNGVFGNEDENDNYILIDQNTGSIVDPIRSTQGGQSNITFDLDASCANHTFTVMATVRKQATGRKTKTAIRTTTTFLEKNAATSQTLSLGKADVFRIIAVRMSNRAWGVQGDYTQDITDRYDLSTGQTESYYGISKLVLKDSFNPPSGPVEVEFEYFQHSNGDYFTVDSYPSDVAYEDIPSFNTYNLRDCIDFRPRVADSGTGFEGTGASYSATVKRGQEITTDYSYYLPRKDKIVLDYRGNFVDVEGVPSLNPQLPETPNLAMNLYNLTIMPYTMSADSNSVVIETVDNRRYTMRDIGKLEKRIANLEDYTTLSLLEQQTSSMRIEDEEGLDRYKQGFVVDNFADSSLCNASDTSLNCSIDADNNVCRPSFTQRSVSMIEVEPSSRDSANYTAWGKVFTLALDSAEPHKVLVDQPYASKTENINPFAVATFLGTIDLNPASDDWFENKYLPDIVNNVEGDYLAKKNSLEGTKWNSWQTTWTGQPTVTSQKVVSRWEGWDTRAEGRHVYQDTTYRTTYAQKETQTRTGIKTSVTARIDYEEVGDKIISTSEIPYMRSRCVLVRAFGMKPYTRFYPYFDNVNIDYWCTPASVIEYEPMSGTFDVSSMAGADLENGARVIETTKNAYWAEETDKTCLDVGDVITSTSNTEGTASNLTAVVVGRSYDGDTGRHYLYVVNIKTVDGTPVDGEYYDDNGNLQTNTRVRTFNANDVITGSLSKAVGRVVSAEPNHNHVYTPLVSNFAGEMFFVYWIPDGDKIKYGDLKDTTATAGLQFRCGERILSLLDNANYDKDNSASSSEATYSAVGVINTRQRSINAVRNAQVVQQSVSDNRTVTNSWSETTVATINKDPLAETFSVDADGGCFLTKVDIYFASKDNNLPVTLQIRTVDNGYPSNKILAFGSVTKRPEDVNLSTNKVTFENDQGVMVEEWSYDTPTTFEFDSPVYVEDATEYAVVLLSDSTKYRVWIAEVGDNVPNQQVNISKQPYNGVLFKSQNASTWTANQNQDLKFTIYRANFRTDAIANIQFKNPTLGSEYLNSNPFQTAEGSTMVRVWHNFHGLYDGAQTYITYDNLNDVDVPTTMLTGTMNFNTSGYTVSGTGSKFLTEVEVGSVLYSADDTMVGVVGSIESDIRLTLVDHPTISGSNIQLSAKASINGIPITEVINQPLVISNVDLNSYVINVSTPAKATGYVGGNHYKGAHIVNYDVIQPNVTYQTFADTGIGFSVSGVTGRSVDGGELVNQATGQIAVVANDNNTLSAPMAIFNAENTNRTSLTMNVQFSSSNPNISPIIDSERVSCVLINNTINDPLETTVNVPELDNMDVFTGNVFSFCGSVDSIHCSLGSGYTKADVTITAPDLDGGVQATAKAVIENGQITAIQITEHGSGYTKAPTAQISGGDGSGATIDVVNMNYNQILTKQDNASLITTGKYVTIEGSTTVSNNGTFLITDSYTGANEDTTVFESEHVFVPESATAQSVLYVRNLFTAEIAPLGGSTASKYITKSVSFEGSCAFARIQFALCCPTPANVDVYVKTYNNGGIRDYDSLPWVKVNPDSAIKKVDVGVESFTDVVYSVNPEATFDMMAVKVVFRSTNSSAVPMLRDFRIVACA